MNDEEILICVICGQEWSKISPFTNRCENPKCDGFCSWGYELNKPESFTNVDGKWCLNPIKTDDE